MVKDTKVETVASRLREISDAVHDEDKYKEYIDGVYADIYYHLERLAKNGGTYAEIPQRYFADKLKIINPIIDVTTIDKIAGEVLTRLGNNGFIIRSYFTAYGIQW